MKPKHKKIQCDECGEVKAHVIDVFNWRVGKGARNLCVKCHRVDHREMQKAMDEDDRRFVTEAAEAIAEMFGRN